MPYSGLSTLQIPGNGRGCEDLLAEASRTRQAVLRRGTLFVLLTRSRDQVNPGPSAGRLADCLCFSDFVQPQAYYPDCSVNLLPAQELCLLLAC